MNFPQADPIQEARVAVPTRPSRARALAWFLVAAIYFILAKQTSAIAAHGLSSGIWFDLVDRSILLFLLILGYSAFGYLGQRQEEPINAMGLERRPGWRGEFALGSAIGWAGVALCTLLIAIFGGIVVFFYVGWFQFLLIFVDLAILLIAAFAQEVAFRGYPFQRLIDATNPVVATLLMSLLYAWMFVGNPGASVASVLLAMFMGWLLSVAYLRTRGLWVGSGIHFAWNASMAVLFGLPLSGIDRYSPVISSTALGPTWLTGFDYGPEGSAVGIFVVLGLAIATVYATRDLKHKYAQPVIIPAGIPVDIDAVARRQHEAAMGPAQPAEPQFVQITGIPSAPATSLPAPENPPPPAEGEADSAESEAAPAAAEAQSPASAEPPSPPQQD